MQFLPPLHYGLVVFAHMRNAAYILDVGSVVTVKVRSHYNVTYLFLGVVLIFQVVLIF